MLQPALTADDRLGCWSDGPTAEPEVSTSWRDLSNPLNRLDPDSIRILPAGEEGKRVSRRNRWMTFGMSSIKRPKASYLGITLSRMFNVLDLELAETAIIVHLADFDEEWVIATARWLQSSFATEMSRGRLQVIHAPRNLYALKQADLHALDLSGFKDVSINGKYYRQEKLVGGHVTYWSQNGKWVLFWCSVKTSVVAHRRWAVGRTDDWTAIQGGAGGAGGACVAFARAPEDMEVLDPIITGWEQFLERWELAPKAGISNLDLSEGELLKFGDSPKRQWWRTKQNLDYTFLMWYAANLSDYYMQLEDDVQPVPHFILSVRSYIRSSLLGKHWVMASFSSLGFIGKLFNNSHIPKLAEFLLTFSTEAPCDWLVWVWIDALSPWPVALDIPKDVANEIEKRQKAEQTGPEAIQKLGFMRDDIQPYYLNSSWPRIFSSPPGAPDLKKLWPGKNGVVDGFLEANVISNMQAHQAFKANLIYPPGDPLGFWTSDTCSQKNDLSCKSGKFIRVIFDEPVQGEIKVAVKQARRGHENDFIKQGSLKSSNLVSCQEPQKLKELTQPEETWKGTMHGTRCLEVTLDRPQKEWIAIREIEVEHMGRTELLTSKAVDKALDKPHASPGFLQPRRHAEPASYAVQHALEAAALGFLAGSAAWLAFWQLSKSGLGQITNSLGCFGPWSLTFILIMDLALVSLIDSSPQSVLTTQPLPQPATYTRAATVCKNGRPREKIPIDWRFLQPGISFVDKALVRHLGPANDPREHGESNGESNGEHGSVKSRTKSRMSIGVIAEPDLDAAAVATSIKQLVASAAGHATVAVLVAQARNPLERRQDFLQKLLHHLRGSLQVGDRRFLHILDPAGGLYPDPPARTDNIDLALLTAFVEPLSDSFMLVELDSVLVQDYPKHAQRFVEYLDSENIPWIVIEFDNLFGIARKLVRSRLLPRLREILVMFPEAPADSIFWDFIDIVGNETAPKSIYLGTDAAKRDRPDVKLQHQKHQALLEHLGDVSSLEGKVQRAQEEFFKKNPIVDSLFDNPPGTLRTNMVEIRQEILQSVYDGSQTSGSEVTCGGHTAKSCSHCPQGHGASWCNRDCGWIDGTCKALFKAEQVMTSKGLWFEIVFDAAQDVEIVSLRMGGTVKPPACSGDSCKDKAPDESPDDEFAHALDDAELLFGQGQMELMGGEVGCRKYFKVRNIAGREVFWKSNNTRYVNAVKCIRISIPRAQQHPLILRAFEVRSSKAGYNNIASLAAAGFNIPPELDTRWSLKGAIHSQRMEEGDQWQEQHLEWVLLMSVALVSGAFAGVLGCLFPKQRKKRRKLAPT